MKTYHYKLNMVLCAALAVILLAGVPCGVLADGGISAPPPVDDTLIPQEEQTQQPAVPEADVSATEQPEAVLPEQDEPDDLLPENGQAETPEPEDVLPEAPDTETAVPPLVFDAPAEPSIQQQVQPEQPYDEEAGPEWDDPLYYKLMDQVSTVALAGEAFERYKPRALADGEVLRRGIDVSVFQYDVDWNTVAASGIDFVFVRTAYRSISTDKLYKDRYGSQNLTGAHDAGLQVGAYIFSQATTVEEAREEARYLISTVKGYAIDLPLVFDYEEATGSSRRLKMSELDRQLKTDICKAFCQEVEAAGYKSMVYSNPYTLNNHLYREQLGRLWLANYIDQTAYAGAYEFWQCGKGWINGIDYETDLNFWFDPTGIATPPGNGNVVTPTPTPAPTATPAPTPAPAVPPENAVSPFSDVTGDKWFYSSVLWAYGKGIVNGVDSTTFGPNATATRGQLVAMLYRMKGQPTVSGSAAFTDLKEDYYKDAVAWAASGGIVSGFSQTVFAPNNKVTREQLATMLYRMAGSPEVSGNLSRFTDAAKVHDYAQNALIWAVEKGVVTGYSDSTVRPGVSASRAEVCTMLCRFAAL